jgi:hypothetical protein
MKAYCHVYVSKAAKEPILTGRGSYPEGAVIIKSKLAGKDGTKPILYTVMTKMAAGYDADHGDWRYSVLEGPSLREVAAGRIDSCIECHDHYKDTDYVTRAYLDKQKSESSQPSDNNQRIELPK